MDNVPGGRFYNYVRLALAEVITVTENDTPRPASYLKFKEIYEKDETIRGMLKPAREFVLRLGDIDEEKKFVEYLFGILQQIEQGASIKINNDLKKKLKEKGAID